jgi:eukaryotic-like serine/threonine-protein kinase
MSSKVSTRWLGFVVAVVVVTALVVLFLLLRVRPTEVPRVIQLPIPEATQSLKEAGLVVGRSSKVATTQVGAGMVLSQSPASGTRVPRLSSVDVTIAIPPFVAVVPGVTGMPIKTGTAILTEALFTTTSIVVFTEKDPSGTIVGQVPSKDTTWTTGRPVGLAVSAGPDDGTGVKVPSLKGTPLKAAMSELERLGLRGSGFVTQIKSPADNVVVDQLPAGGTLVGPGSTILLLFEAP